MDHLVQYFLGMMTLVFAVASVIAGIFTAYFGSGKSRAVGAILIIIGLIVGVIFLWGVSIIPLGTVPVMLSTGLSRSLVPWSEP